jgi:predicted amidohydrolase
MKEMISLSRRDLKIGSYRQRRVVWWGRMCYFEFMNIALAQIAPHLGNLEKNWDLHQEMAAKALRAKADLLVFPELSLTGYKLRDLVESVAQDPRRSPRFKELKSLSRELALVVGFIEEHPGEKGIFYNSAAYLAGGKLQHVHRKVFLPTFGMFEEGRFWAAGNHFATFAAPSGPTGLMICRDFLHINSGYLLFAGGAELMITISASPGRGLAEENGFGSSRMWELMGESLSFFTTSAQVYCNRVGMEDGMAFAGGSFVFSPMGKRIAQAPYFEESLLLAELDPDDVRKARRTRPWKRDDKPEVTLASLQRTLLRHDD